MVESACGTSLSSCRIGGPGTIGLPGSAVTEACVTDAERDT
jgi:hypothetical protein